ncbi:DUF423 domain-containing protein [Magnetococcales bacterium HHB-1]
MIKYGIPFAALNGFMAVGMGAYSQHVLENLPAKAAATLQTSMAYQIYHALALLLVILFLQFWPKNKWLTWSANAFMIGITLFSGSLYLMVLEGSRSWGAITPFGGFGLLGGWLLLAWAGWQQHKEIKQS